MKNPVDLKDKFVDALGRFYAGIVADRIYKEGWGEADIDPTVQAYADCMLADCTQNPRHLISIIRGEADPEIIDISLARAINGKAPFGRSPYPPGTRLFQTPIGDIVAGPTHALLNFRGNLVDEAQNARAALLTSATTVLGYPRLGEFMRIYVEGERVPICSSLMLEGGFALQTSPFRFEIRDRQGSVVMRDDLSVLYERAIAGIRYQGDLWQTFSHFTHDLLFRVDNARRRIVTIVGNTELARQLLQESSDRLLVESTVRAVQHALMPIELQSEAALHTFTQGTPLRGTLTGQAIEAQVTRLPHAMLPLMFVRMAPPPSALEYMEDEHALALDYAGIRELVSDAGLGMLFDLQKHVKDVYAQSPFMQAANLKIHIMSHVSTFCFFDPIPARLLLDTLIYRVVCANTQRAPLDVEFDFNAARQTIEACFSMAQPPNIVGALQDVASIWNFKGIVEAEEDEEGVRLLRIAREHQESPAERLTRVWDASAGRRTRGWDNLAGRAIPSPMLPAEAQSIQDEAIAVSADAASELVIPSAFVASGLAGPLIK